MSINIPNKIIIHCSATGPDQDITAGDIDRWHKARGWRCIGYHWVITRAGVLQVGRPETRTGAHCKGHNAGSIGICMVGGVDENEFPDDNFTDEQWDTLRDLISHLCVQYEITEDDIHGHYEFSDKACPSFDVEAKLDEWK